jgi:uncharacterized membrane protein
MLVKVYADVLAEVFLLAAVAHLQVHATAQMESLIVMNVHNLILINLVIVILQVIGFLINVLLKAVLVHLQQLVRQMALAY